MAGPWSTALTDGRLDEALVDTAVRRMLRMKFRLGLFERPFVEMPDATAMASLAVEEARVARTLAVRSMVLVENDGILPLATAQRRIAVIGPIADSARDLLGDYSHLLHIETLAEMRRQKDNVFGFPLDDEVEAMDELAGRQTILDAIRARFAVVRGHARRRDRDCATGTDGEIEEAVEIAARGGRRDRRPRRALRA